IRSDASSGGAIETPTRTIATKEQLRMDRVVPSPDGRYLAVFGDYLRSDLHIYDSLSKSWTDFGEITVHPSDDWSYIQPSWNPCFADGARIVFLRDSTITVASPNGKAEAEIETNAAAGIPVPSPDGRSIAYVTFEPRPMKIRDDLQFWGGTTIWVVPV